ncbi:transposase [Bradyrhizobium sp. USDA 4461]
MMVATKKGDFRKRTKGLVMLVCEDTKADRAKRADRIKLIFWDGYGLCLFKQLDEGVFRWLKNEDRVMRLSAAESSALLEGLDWRGVHAARETVAPT